MYAIYKQAFVHAAQPTMGLGGVGLDWHELSEAGHKAWTSVAHAANGTLKL